MDLVQLSHQPISSSSGIVIPSAAGYSPVDSEHAKTNGKVISKPINLGYKDDLKAPRYEDLIGEDASLLLLLKLPKNIQALLLYIKRRNLPRAKSFARTNCTSIFKSGVGQTPLVDITRLANPKVGGVRILAKCEFLNPGFSMKDRIIKNILDKAEETGKLQPGGTIVAASSGNTGAAVAMLAAMRGYKAVITTSPKCSREKMDTIRAYGAQLLVSPSG